MLCHTPVERDITTGHQATVFNQSRHQRMHFESRWNRGDFFAQTFEFSQIQTSIGCIHPFFIQIARPVVGKHMFVVGQNCS